MASAHTGLVLRAPAPALRPFVKVLWASAPSPPPAEGGRAERERVLPTGTMHVAFRLGPQPLRVFDDDDDGGAALVLGHAVVGGARLAPYVRDVSNPEPSVGAQLRPGACGFFFGATAEELAGRHTRLEELWGASAANARERLHDEQSPGRRLDLFEEMLRARLSATHTLHPAVAHALDRFTTTSASVGAVARETGYSHRRFIALFRRAVGLSPKAYCRLLRFQRVLKRLAQSPARSLVGLAFGAGYADQAHLTRQFRELAGVTPGEYRALAPPLSHHVRVPTAGD